MAETRRKFDRDFKEGAVRLVRETGKPIAEVARDLGIKEGTLGNWVNADRRRRGDGDGALGEDERAELARLRKENADLRDEGWAVSKNTVAAVMRELGLAARRKKKRKATTRPGRGRQDARARRTWSSGTSRRGRSTSSGTATAPRSPPARASSTWPR